MGKYDEISEERLRTDLLAFARLILRLDEEGRLTDGPAHLQRMLGDLRQKLFAYEVKRGSIAHGPRSSGDTPSPEDSVDPGVLESLRVVREARRRTEEMLREWEPGGSGEDPADG